MVEFSTPDGQEVAFEKARQDALFRDKVYGLKARARLHPGNPDAQRRTVRFDNHESWTKGAFVIFQLQPGANPIGSVNPEGRNDFLVTKRTQKILNSLNVPYEVVPPVGARVNSALVK